MAYNKPEDRSSKYVRKPQHTIVTSTLLDCDMQINDLLVLNWTFQFIFILLSIFEFDSVNH